MMADSTAEESIRLPHGRTRRRNILWLNWFLTVPVAVEVLLCAYAAVLGVPGCPDEGCTHMRPFSPSSFDPGDPQARPLQPTNS